MSKINLATVIPIPLNTEDKSPNDILSSAAFGSGRKPPAKELDDDVAFVIWQLVTTVEDVVEMLRKDIADREEYKRRMAENESAQNGD